MNILKQLFCQHEWTKAQGYVDLLYDVCKKCGKKRATNEENIASTHFKFPPIIIKIKKTSK